MTAIEDSINALYDVKSNLQVLYQKLLKSFKPALKVPQLFGASVAYIVVARINDVLAVTKNHCYNTIVFKIFSWKREMRLGTYTS